MGREIKEKAIRLSKIVWREKKSKWNCVDCQKETKAVRVAIREERYADKGEVVSGEREV